MPEFEHVEANASQPAGKSTLFLEQNDQVRLHRENGFDVRPQKIADLRLVTHFGRIVAELGDAGDTVSQPERVEHFSDAGRG